MEIQIRKFNKKDYAGVTDLNNSLNRSNKGDGLWNKDLRTIENSYHLSGGEFLVAEIGDEIVGMGALLKIDDVTGEVKRMRVSKNHQRKGIGLLILTKLEEFAKLNNFQRITLDTSVQQVPAQKLYENRGYKEFDRKMIDGFDSILYEKYL